MERVAVVTGASQGLGLALAEALVAKGWSIAIDARRAERLADATAHLRDLAGDPERVVALAGDIAEPGHRRALAAAARSLGEVRLVVNNASTLGASPLLQLTELPADALATTFETNVVAPLALVAALAADLGDGATIINVSSDAAVEAYETWGGYGASKAALDHASGVLAAEHPQWRVLAVDPGDMRTEMHQDAFPGEDIGDRPEPAESVPGLLALIDGPWPSGRYRARELAP